MCRCRREKIRREEPILTERCTQATVVVVGGGSGGGVVFHISSHVEWKRGGGASQLFQCMREIVLSTHHTQTRHKREPGDPISDKKKRARKRELQL